MATYNSLAEVLRSSLVEYLTASKLALEYRKKSPWPEDGCLGFASGVLLMCVIDALGSYFAHGAQRFVIDGKARAIDGQASKHFFVLNHDVMFKQGLSGKAIERIYDVYRNLLAHNAAIASSNPLIFAPACPEAFPVVNGERCLNLPVLHNLSCAAVGVFLETVDPHRSHAAKLLTWKSSGPPAEGT